ncbi:MAG: hypothetical protein K8S55_15895 [Phycisphaerae bacterium]|nr:hypothetical protein [Phycisphaerae bacterium]
MTTLRSSLSGDSYRGAAELLDRIEQVRYRRRMVGLLSAVAAVIAVGSVAVLLASLVGYVPGQPPAALRWGVFCVLVILAGVAAGGLVKRLFFSRQNHAQTARFIEQSMPQLHNDLINSVLLSRDTDQPSAELVQCAILESLQWTEQYDLVSSVSLRPLKRWAVAGWAGLIVLLVFAAFQPGPFGRGLHAALTPGRFVPASNDILLVSLSPGDATVFPGDPLDIALEVRNPRGQTFEAEVVIEGQKNALPMFAVNQIQNPDDPFAEGGNSRFGLRLDAVHESMNYFVRVRVRGGGGQSRFPAERRWYNVRLKDIAVRSFRIRYDYPKYTGWKSNTVTLAPADAVIEAPTGSRADLEICFSDAVDAGFIEFRGGKRKPLVRLDDGRRFAIAFPIDAPGGFRLVFTNLTGKVLKQLPNGRAGREGGAANGPDFEGYYRINAIADEPPVVEFLTPNRHMTLPGEAVLKLQIKASDKYGLSDLQLWAGVEDSPATAVKGVAIPKLSGKREVTVNHGWKLAGYREGDVIVYYATASDNRKLPKLGGPQSAASHKFKITIRSAAKIAKARAQLFDQLQKKLMAILELQARLRVSTATAWQRKKSLGAVKAVGRNVHAGQKSVQRQLASLVKHFPFEKQMEEIQVAAALLARNEAPLAVGQAEVLVSLAELAKRDIACSHLAATQDAIIDVLKDMLAIMPTLAAKADDVKQPTGSDLTADQRRKKREAFADKLKEFMADQRKIIAASERLNKKNLDDFTKADEKLLKEFEALEDKWEKFLNEAFTDFSKLAQQDFSTPAMLKELISVKTDITMAKDALKKKTTEIATACENNALENAESLTANLEKWLPDEPDRIKWNMEAPTGQDNIEQAELPKELEDLVGDLLEEEEDLFEEMDDLSSKATGSFDKGAGWDAMDGPISSMNAQGVTGNQLPNTSEIQGRSGEGRTGKSAGEFVEDKAVGKGGRRTPTRLGDEPFSKGQVDDTSTDPPGGATGGGKLSGSGEEGLEGHTPAELQKQMKRMAGKQAGLVNRAERVQANFKVGDYSSFRMQQAVTLMNRIKGDLDKGDYRNALRRRTATLRALRQTKRMLGTKVQVTADTSAAMPKYVRDNIADTMNSGNLPEEYREILQQYYKRLSERQK